MGLPIYALKKLEPYLKGARVLCLSYPDIVASAEQLKKAFGFDTTLFTNRGEVHQVKYNLPETMDVFKKFGADMECVDVFPHTGFEKIVDLNYPCDLGKYDLVIDPGTMEHCFNIGQAMMNAANAVKAGGHIFHLSPLMMINHGFYNICPTMMFDFYTQNDWEISTLEAVNSTNIKFHEIHRFHMNVEYILCCFAKRKTEAALKFPMQSKYLMSIPAQKAA